MQKKYFILLLILVSACNNPKNAESEKEIPVSKITSQGVNVTATTIPNIVFNKQLVSNGIVESVEKTDLRFKTGNRIAGIKVKNGQRVVKGQLLAHLENTLLKNNLEKAKIELEKAKIKLEEAKINYNYGNSDVNNISPEILHKLELKSGVLDAKNTFKDTQIRYDQTILKAQFNGLIANIKKRQGDFITSSDVFCTLLNPKKLEVLFTILENELKFVSKGQLINLKTFNNSSNFKAVIKEINPAVDKNGLINIKAVLKETSNELLDGMHVKIYINQPVKDVLVVPKEAVVLRSNRKVVFSVNNGLAKWNYITSLYENSNYIAIKKGENLKKTDTIIISGNINLSHDAKINTKFVSADSKDNL